MNPQHPETLSWDMIIAEGSNFSTLLDSQNIVYNDKYVVIVPKSCDNLIEAFNYSFNNVLYIDNSIASAENITTFINKNKFETIIFVDYLIEYETIMRKLNEKHIILDAI